MPRLAVACSGLGRVPRGFETFAAEVFAALRPQLDALLVQGAGAEAPGVRTAWSLDRRRLPQGGAVPGARAYKVEQATFALGALPALRRFAPDVVLTSDRELGRLLRRLLPRARLLFSNGAPYRPPFDWADHVHHTLADTYAMAGGGPGHTLLPYGFALAPPGPDRRAALGLPAGVPIVLAVGTVSANHKRTDHLVREVAALHPRPHLVLLGDQMVAGDVPALARELLGPDGVTLRTVAPDAVGAYYDAADAFALASLIEGFGRVYVEALAHGLPCVVHDTPHTRDLFGGHGVLVDMAAPGAAGAGIAAALRAGRDPARAAYARRRFSWDALAPAYLEMVTTAATAPRRRPRGR